MTHITTHPPYPVLSFVSFQLLSISDAMPFKEILEWMQSKNMIHLAPAVAKLGVQNLQQLKEIDRTTLQARQWSLGDIDILMNLLHEHNVPHAIQNLPVPRRDFPKLEPRQRGSLKRALEAALPNCQRERIESLEDDFYSNSSKPSQQSLFTTWSRVAAAWQLPPIPITRQLLLAVGASMKYAGYRSPKNYFYKAAQVHREVLQQDLPPHLHLLLQKILRSITRGQGPTPFKDSFELELFHIPLPRSGLPRHGNWFSDRFASRDITIIACWWMLRGIEAAAAKLHHIWYHETNLTKFAYFTLPVQKNDPTGQCVSRGHPCICRSGSPNLLCPYHAIIRHTKRLTQLFPAPNLDQIPFIPTDAGEFPSKQDILKIFSSAIELTSTPLTRPGPNGEPLPRFGEHVCRVSGAQFLSRMGYSLEAIQLIGRWGSDAVKRYIQEAPLAATLSNPQNPIPEADHNNLKMIIRTELERLSTNWWILNQQSNMAHIPAVPETAENHRWRTLCGWHYGTGSYRKTFTKPDEP